MHATVVEPAEVLAGVLGVIDTQAAIGLGRVTARDAPPVTPHCAVTSNCARQPTSTGVNRGPRKLTRGQRGSRTPIAWPIAAELWLQGADTLRRHHA
jgi:hypothetical protein